jgi:putative chitinase
MPEMKQEQAKHELYLKLLSDERVSHDDRWIAYIMATVEHETGETYLPIKEYGGDAYFTKRYELNGKIAASLGNTQLGDGARFCGRGYVQITGRSNYDRFSHIVGVNLVDNPDLALDPHVAYEIMVIGMTKGRFTGKKLSDFLSAEKNDTINSRKIINRLDRAKDIAAMADRHLPLIASIKSSTTGVSLA